MDDLRNCTICGEDPIIDSCCYDCAVGCIVCGQLAHPGWELCDECTGQEIQDQEKRFAKPNPYCKNHKWYWYDEIFLPSGPYDTEVEARNSLNAYVVWLNGEIFE